MLNKDLVQQIEQGSLEQSLDLVARTYPGQVVFSSSLGQEDQVITDIIFRNKIPIKVFTIDTGRLFNETYDLLDKTLARYQQPIAVYFPDAADVEEYVFQKGINAFFESVENRKTCCAIRKVKPLNRALAGARVWITGLRAGQSENRKDMRAMEWDEERDLYKFNPLIDWNYEQVLQWLDRFNVPYNSLHNKGFISIGCAPCTRAIEPGENPRSGRWWWESSQKECGLHSTGSDGQALLK